MREDLRKQFAKTAINVFGTAIVIPAGLTLFNTPPAMVVFAGIASILAVAAWGFSKPGVGWRRRMLPSLAMIVGALCFTIGAVWFYGQRPPQQRQPAAPPPDPASKASGPRSNAETASAAGTHDAHDGEPERSAENALAVPVKPAEKKEIQPENADHAASNAQKAIEAAPTAPPPPVFVLYPSELARRRALIFDIMQDYQSSHDGMADSTAGLLDQGTKYINEQLVVRGETWKFDRETRKALGYPPAIGDSYEQR